MTNVKHKKGDVLKALKDGKVSAVLHVCSSHGHMNSGFAKQVRAQYPKAFISYENTIGDNGRIKMGSVTTACGIYNMVAQENYGRDGKRYIDYGALAVAVMRAIKLLKKTDKHVAIPYHMGSDLAGGDWDTVLEIVKGFCSLYNVTLSVYKFDGIPM